MADSEMLKDFLLETFENLSSIGEELTTYERNPGDEELLNSIYRKIHTLKGASSFLGLEKLQEITHSVESILDFIRDRKFFLTPELTDIFLESFDICSELAKKIEATGGEGDENYSDIIQKLASYMEKASLSKEGIPAEGQEVHPDLMKEEQKVEQKVEEKVEVEDEEAPAEPIGTISVKKEENTESVPAVVKPAKESISEHAVKEASASGSTGSISDTVIKVNVKLLDKIMNIVGELVLTRNQILQFASAYENSELNRFAQQLNAITTDLQTDIMTTRMQPLGVVFNKFERVVRDLSRNQGKQIRLEITGKETELDKTLLEAIRDPMVHLVRNSVDHGIELPAERLKLGKEEEGVISIIAGHESGQVAIEISDNGGGIAIEKVLNRAVSKGLITSVEAKTLSRSEILNFIMNPGFSTAETITNISGRGVGMDVVKNNIEKIGGTIGIETREGEGTTFKLKIPLTLAIIQALVVKSGNEKFAIAQANLLELVRLEGEGAANRIERIQEAEFFRLRGNLIPVFKLNDGLEMSVTPILDSEQVMEKAINIVILNAGGRVYGLVVDEVLDTEEIVVKPLSSKLKNLVCFAGATIMGDGGVALILDVIGLFNTLDKGRTKTPESSGAVDFKEDIEEFEIEELILCSLGDGNSYGVPLRLVKRLEVFSSKKIEWSGERPLVKYGDLALPLVNMEQTLNLGNNSILTSLEERKEFLVPCIVTNLRGHDLGMVVNEILDITSFSGTINTESVDRKGILGVVFVEDQAVTLLDFHSIFDLQLIGAKLLEEDVEIRSEGRVLLVDDSPLHLKIISEYLMENGIEVDTAMSAKAALQILSVGKEFDVMITDVEMPEMSGWDLVKKIRSSGKAYAQVPIVVLTGNFKDLDEDLAEDLGVPKQIEKGNMRDVYDAIIGIIEQ